MAVAEEGDVQAQHERALADPVADEALRAAPEADIVPKAALGNGPDDLEAGLRVDARALEGRDGEERTRGHSVLRRPSGRRAIQKR